MKKSIALASFLALALVAGCASSNKTDSSGNMGVVGESKKDSCCSQKSEAGSMGVVGESKKDSCCSQKSEAGSMGVMSDAKADHCAGKTGSCPMGKTEKQN
jgi:hypothetical protein